MGRSERAEPERYTAYDAYVAGAVDANLYGAEKLIEEAIARVLQLEVSQPGMPMYGVICDQLNALREVRKTFGDRVAGRTMTGATKP